MAAQNPPEFLYNSIISSKFMAHGGLKIPSGQEELRDLRDLTGSPTGKPDDEAALDEVGSLTRPHRSK